MKSQETKDLRLMRDNGIGFMSNEVYIDYTDTRSLKNIKKEYEETTSNKYFIIDYALLNEEDRKDYIFFNN